MQYTKTIKKPLKTPLGKTAPSFKTADLGVGKATPFFVSATIPSLKRNQKLIYKADSEEEKQIPVDDLNANTKDLPKTVNVEDYYNTTGFSCTQKNTKIKYHCSRDDEYIEVPGGTDTVVYTDETGTDYEVSIDDLIEYDDDHEIEYTSGKKRKNIPFMLLQQTKVANKVRVH